MRGLVLVALCGCAGVAAAPSPPVPAVERHPLGAPLVVPGEAMVYDVSFRGIHVGSVQVAIGKPGWIDDRPAVIVRSHGATEGVLALIGDLDWQLATTIDLDTGMVLQVVEDATVTFNGRTETSHHDRKHESLHSIHSAAAALRGWRSAPAQEEHFHVRIDDATLGIAIHEAAHELLPSGDKPAVRYDGVAHEKFPFEVWVSDDAARVPLRMRTATRWGEVIVELVEYTPPRD